MIWNLIHSSQITIGKSGYVSRTCTCLSDYWTNYHVNLEFVKTRNFPEICLLIPKHDFLRSYNLPNIGLKEIKRTIL